MKHIAYSIGTTPQILAGVAIALFALAALLVPVLTFAASYAYVNTLGEVRTVTADTPTSAIDTAPGIHSRSGVLLLDSQADQDVVGEDVSGV